MAKRQKKERYDLTSRAAREGLDYRGKPYFVNVRRGLALGYRKSKRGAGNWLARYREGGDYTFEPIGAADDRDDAEGALVFDHDQAQDAALERWRKRQFVKKGVEDPRKPYSVDRGMSDYLDYLRINGGDVDNASRTIEAHVLPQFGGRSLADVTTAEWTKWLHRLAETPARVRTKPGAKQQYKQENPSDPEVQRRRRNRVKRIWANVRAACNRAWREGKVADRPWARVQMFKDVDKARETSLKRDGAQRLLNAAGDERDLLHAALATGARLGELVALNIGDYDVDNQSLYIRKSKTGKARWVILDEGGAKLFDRLSAGRAPDDIMIPAPDDTRWDKARVQYRLIKACERAKVGHVSFHQLRHCYCTFAIEGGAPLHVVAANTGHSVAILTKHYSHLSDQYRREQIRAAVPQFEVPESNVERFKTG